MMMVVYYEVCVVVVAATKDFKLEIHHNVPF